MSGPAGAASEVRRPGLVLAGLLLAFAGVLLFRVGVPPLASRAEERCADVVATMVSTGDWLVPRHHGELRLQKPPLFYWEASAAGLLAGRATLGSLRLPSVLAAVLLAALVFAWGRWLFGTTGGLLAAAALVMMQSVLTEGRTGTAEMSLALCCNLALFTFSRMHALRRPALLPLFALWTALAVLAKATAAVLIVGLPIAVFLVWQGEWRRALAPRVMGWLLLALLAGFSWYLIMIEMEPGAWDRLFADMVLPVGVETGAATHSATHYGPVWEYLPTICSAAFPAVLLLPLAVVWVLRRDRPADPRVRLPVVTFVALFVAFSLIPQKQKHYLLPLLPSLALLLAGSLQDLQSRRPAAGRRVLLALALVGLACALAALAGIWIVGRGVFGVSPWLCAAATLGALALAAGLLASAWQGRWLRFVGLAATGTLLAGLIWYGSLDIWRRQFEDGSVVARPDYVAARWDAAFQRYPPLGHLFRMGKRDY